jgi:hypothetical protein
MARLTARGENGFAYFPRCFDTPCCGFGCAMEECEFLEMVCEKLAKFEDKEDSTDETD